MAGIPRAKRFAQEQEGFEAMLNQVFSRVCGGLNIVQPDHVAGKARDFAIDKHHR